VTETGENSIYLFLSPSFPTYGFSPTSHQVCSRMKLIDVNYLIGLFEEKNTKIIQNVTSQVGNFISIV